MSKSKALIQYNKNKTGLTLKEEAFCRFYTSNEETFGNGTASYIKAFRSGGNKKGSYAGARQLARRLLTKVNIINRINEILKENSLNDAFVDGQLTFLINQYADFSSKMRAIDIYYKIRGRYSLQKIGFIETHIQNLQTKSSNRKSLVELQ